MRNRSRRSLSAAQEGLTTPGPEKIRVPGFSILFPGGEDCTLNIYIDTCVLPRLHLESGEIYREQFGPSLGFELLMMFDIPGFEENLRRHLDLFAGGPLLFHEPVWGVEHSDPKGSAGYENGMYHLRLTKKYAEILRPEKMVYHLNNGIVPPAEKEAMLRTSLENLEETREMFTGVEILVENTGIRQERTQLLDQEEFTDLCRDRQITALIDVGHANANGWDIPKLIRDLEGRIGGFHLHNNDGAHDQHSRVREGTLDFRALFSLIRRYVPDAPRVIEYISPAYHGLPLLEDIAFVQALAEGNG